VPLFYFILDDGAGAPDSEGVDLPGPRQAHAEAVLLLGELLRARDPDSWNGQPATLTVKDASGSLVLRIDVSGPAANQA
jgi:hypothetical protein